MKTKLAKEGFISQATILHKGKYKYNFNDIINSRAKIEMVCPTHGSFFQDPYHHLKGHGCPKCGTQRCALSKITPSEEFFKKVNLRHNFRYDYTKSIFLKMKSKIIITCKEHGDFYQSPKNHLRGAGCPKCGIKKAKNSKIYSTEKFIKKANLKHKNKYEYFKTVYLGFKSKIVITCKDHGDFYQLPCKHLSGIGCLKCSYVNKPKKSNKSEFISKATNIHASIYDYSLVEYKGALPKINIICKIHGSFFQSPSRHLRGQGCPKCSFLRAFKSKIKDKRSYIPRLDKIHKGIYDYSKINCITYKDKVEVICKTHGSFFMQLFNHLNGWGCPLCLEDKKTFIRRERFISRSKNLYGDKFDYSKVFFYVIM